jgi:hypothetical protein
VRSPRGAQSLTRRPRIENFLTEAIAIATVADPRPILSFMGRGGRETTQVEVMTQQRSFGRPDPVEGERPLVAVDVVLSMVRGQTRPEEIWLEVKAEHPVELRRRLGKPEQHPRRPWSCPSDDRVRRSRGRSQRGRLTRRVPWRRDDPVRRSARVAA